MLKTDAYAFLNINDPVCAWAAYRSVLVSASRERGRVSVWSASRMRSDSHVARVQNELIIEAVRLSHFPDRISRLWGMFCFLDLESAERALSWAPSIYSHYRPEFLAELSLSEAGPRRDRLDANWFTQARRDTVTGLFTNLDWIFQYWSGSACPEGSPIWETLVDGRMIVLGTELRERAYEVTKKGFPDSLAFLEIARLAATLGSDLGNVFALLVKEGESLSLRYHLDMRDADNPAFLEKIEDAKRIGEPINWDDIAPHFAKDSFGNVPDLRRFGFTRPAAELPYIGPPPQKH